MGSRDGVLGSADLNECVVRVVEMEKDKQDTAAAMSLTPDQDLARGVHELLGRQSPRCDPPQDSECGYDLAEPTRLDMAARLGGHGL